jgi:hypothetical protein
VNRGMPAGGGLHYYQHTAADGGDRGVLLLSGSGGGQWQFCPTLSGGGRTPTNLRRDHAAAHHRCPPVRCSAWLGLRVVRSRHIGNTIVRGHGEQFTDDRNTNCVRCSAFSSLRSQAHTGGRSSGARCECVIRARLLARSETTLPRRRRLRWLERRAHRPVRDVRR